MNLCHPGGETKLEVKNRIEKTVSDYINQHPDIKNLWVVSHGVAMRSLMGQFGIGNIKNTAVHRLVYDDNKCFKHPI